MVDGKRVRMGVVMAVTLIAVVSTVAGQQSGQGQQTPNPAQKKYPYPVVRDLAATVPRGPRPMPSPPLGAGPWTLRNDGGEEDSRVGRHAEASLIPTASRSSLTA